MQNSNDHPLTSSSQNNKSFVSFNKESNLIVVVLEQAEQTL